MLPHVPVDFLRYLSELKLECLQQLGGPLEIARLGGSLHLKSHLLAGPSARLL